jgi:hypothetical protein
LPRYLLYLGLCLGSECDEAGGDYEPFWVSLC